MNIRSDVYGEVANRQTNRQTHRQTDDRGYHITSLAEVTISWDESRRHLPTPTEVCVCVVVERHVFLIWRRDYLMSLASRWCSWRVYRRASDSSSGWLDDHYSSVSSRHQLSWSRQQCSPADVSPQPRRTVDEPTRPGDRHYGRQLGLTRQPPSSLTALVEYVSLLSTSRFLFSCLNWRPFLCASFSPLHLEYE